jgi:hypothetical protein
MSRAAATALGTMPRVTRRSLRKFCRLRERRDGRGISVCERAHLLEVIRNSARADPVLKEYAERVRRLRTAEEAKRFACPACHAALRTCFSPDGHAVVFGCPAGVAHVPLRSHFFIEAPPAWWREFHDPTRWRDAVLR